MRTHSTQLAIAVAITALVSGTYFMVIDFATRGVIA